MIIVLNRFEGGAQCTKNWIALSDVDRFFGTFVNVRKGNENEKVRSISFNIWDKFTPVTVEDLRTIR